MKRKIAKMTCALLATTLCVSPFTSAVGINPTETVYAASTTTNLSSNGHIQWLQGNTIKNTSTVKLARGETFRVENVKNVTTSTPKLLTVTCVGNNASYSNKDYNIAAGETSGTGYITVTMNDNSTYKIKVTIAADKMKIGDVDVYYRGGTSSTTTINFKATDYNVSVKSLNPNLVKVTKKSNNKFVIKAVNGKANSDDLYTTLQFTANGKKYYVDVCVNGNGAKSDIKSGDYDMVFKFTNVSLGTFNKTWKSAKCTWDYLNW